MPPEQLEELVRLLEEEADTHDGCCQSVTVELPLCRLQLLGYAVAGAFQQLPIRNLVPFIPEGLNPLEKNAAELAGIMMLLDSLLRLKAASDAHKWPEKFGEE